ncbi:hypothetical protein [Allosphingosinicella humi]
MKSVRLGLCLGAIAAIAGCIPAPRAPAPQPPAPPPVAPPALPPAPPLAWQDLPLSPGTWSYDAARPQAVFGSVNGGPSFAVRCDHAARLVILSRVGGMGGGSAGGGAMTIRTSFGARSLPTSAPDVSASLPANDRFLDSMVFSRGRFTVEVPGAPMLVIPAWPEPARVIEDCRG